MEVEVALGKTMEVDDNKAHEYPYEVDGDDHCESPIEAYRDIAPILERFAVERYKSKESLRIYDPYYCEGSVKERLNSLGFLSVYNVKEDFYKRMAANDLPEYDVLVTNPPYSEDHMDKLIRFVFSTNKPWFLLLPNYVYCKPYYEAQIHGTKYCSPLTFYVTAEKRYLYTTPKGRRQAKSGKFTSPFPSFWYCNLFRYLNYVDSSLGLHSFSIAADTLTTFLDP
jgi:hypothetical protein